MRAAWMGCVLVLAATSMARADRPWFVAARAEYIRDSRIDTTIGYGYFLEGPTGVGLGLEAGTPLRPWISAAMTYQLTLVSARYTTDPGVADLAERQHRIGPQVDLWPLPGRLRVGIGLVLSLRRTERVTHFSRDPNPPSIRDEAGEVLVVQLGGVPLRWRRCELDLSAGYSRTLGHELSSPHTITTLSVGLGIRWRSR